jgi:tryptophan synthase alpha chain
MEGVRTAIHAGASMIELTAVYSDPLADGPTLCRAHDYVLRKGHQKKDALSLYKKITDSLGSAIPVMIIEYANIIFQAGLDSYYKKIREAGITHCITPDLLFDPEDRDGFRCAAKKAGIKTILLAAPNTSDDRLDMLVRETEDMLYAIAIKGTTGERASLGEDSKSFLARIRDSKIRVGRKNLAVTLGFGLSRPEHVREALAAGADAVVVCSAIARIMEEAGGNIARTNKNVSNFISPMVNVFQE